MVPARLLKEDKAQAKNNSNSKKHKRNGKSTARSRRKAVGDNGSGRIEVAKPMPKTWLKPEELVYFRKKLLAKRNELVGDMEAMEKEALRKNGDGAGDGTRMPIHMADVGSDNYEQEFSIGLIESERELLREIDDAIKRIQDETYGMCMATHQPISKERLRAKPWAKYCIEYKRSQENGRHRGVK